MHVLAIDISKYRMPDYELKLAAKDVTEFGDALAKVGGSLLGKDNVFVTTLTDDEVAAAFDRIAAKAKLGDVFVL